MINTKQNVNDNIHTFICSHLLITGPYYMATTVDTSSEGCASDVIIFS